MTLGPTPTCIMAQQMRHRHWKNRDPGSEPSLWTPPLSTMGTWVRRRLNRGWCILNDSCSEEFLWHSLTTRRLCHDATHRPPEARTNGSSSEEIVSETVVVAQDWWFPTWATQPTTLVSHDLEKHPRVTTTL